MKKRPTSHITDSAGAQLLRHAFPEEWVVREYHPDYGIDFAVEVFDSQEGGFVTLGEHFFVQLKSHAAAHWRDQAKAGHLVDARIINTSSGAGILGSVGQAAYSAAKGGIISLTLVQAAELGRYGITANAIAPAARTRPRARGAVARVLGGLPRIPRVLRAARSRDVEPAASPPHLTSRDSPGHPARRLRTHGRVGHFARRARSRW